MGNKKGSIEELYPISASGKKPKLPAEYLRPSSAYQQKKHSAKELHKQDALRKRALIEEIRNYKPEEEEIEEKKYIRIVSGGLVRPK